MLAVSAVTGVAALGVGVAPASAFVLTVDLAGAGTGAVTSSPAGISCSNTPGQVQTDCSFDFPNFTTVTLSATPAGEFVFRGWSGTAGGQCGSGSANPCLTSNFLFSPVSATATFGPPPDPPLVATEPAVEPVGVFSAMLRGRVNPQDFAVSNCYFELGTTTDYGRKVPCLPSSLGSGSSDVAVSAGSGTLKAATTYHFRLVAKNVGGTRVGEDQTFTTAAYAENLSPLPGYGYELVSPPMTQGQRAKLIAPVPSSEDELFLLTNVGGLPGSEWLDAFGMTYVAQRSEGKWKTVPISPSGVDYPSVGEASQPADWSSDGRRTLWMPSLPGQQNSDTVTPVVRDRQGAEQIAGPTLVGSSGSVAQYAGGSDDLRTLVFATQARPTLTGGGTDTRATSVRSLIVVRRAPDGTFTARPVAHQGGAPMQPTCGMELGDGSTTGLGAVSGDGRKIFFSPSTEGPVGAGCVGATQQRVWVKVDDNDPIDISAPQCSPGGCSATSVATRFEGASDDGNRVYLSTEQELLDGDGDTSLKRDLFEYTFNPGGGGTLRAVTSSSTAAGAGVSGVPRVSADGSRVYFVATGAPQVTTPNARGAVPVAGNPNLYVYERQSGDATGRVAFVGRLATADSSQLFGTDSRRTVQASDDGRFLAFVSRADLTGDRSPGDTHLDVFRYDAEQDDLRRLWSDAPAVNGAVRTDGATLTVCECSSSSGARNKALRTNNYMSQDGAVIGFSTTVALDPRDQNTTNDAYVWTAESDAVHLVTSGRGSELQDAFTFVSRSGDMIGFSSATGLVPEHTSGQTGAYVLRRGGGFAPPDPDPVPCSGDGCQGPGTAPLGSPSIGSIGFAGRGNVPSVSGRVSASVRVSKLKAVSGSAGRLRVRVPGAGRISVAGSSVRRASRSASKAGRYSVRIALSSRARQSLRKRKTLKVAVRVSYRAKGGRSASKRVMVTFKARKGGR